MKKFVGFVICFVMLLFVGCGECKTKAIELMGAGERIHDTFTFANTGVSLSNAGNKYIVSGSVEKLENEKVKKEFEIPENVIHVVVVKLTAIDSKVDKNKVKITVDGVENYDAEHLNGSNYTYIILQAVPEKQVSIDVQWNEEDEIKNYIIEFSKDLNLK